MPVPSIRSVETALRASGMSAADAKREAAHRLAEMATLPVEGSPTMTKLARALERFAPRYRHIANFPHTASLGQLSMIDLKRARAAMANLDPADTDNWEADFALAKAGAAELDQMISQLRAYEAESARTARPVDGQENVQSFRNVGGGTGGRAPLLRNVETGALIRTYRHDEPVASNGYEPDFGLGQMVRAAVTGNWQGVPSHVRAGSAGSGPAGGFLIPSELSGHVIDLARAKARVLQAGAQTMPMSNGNLSIAVVTGDPQAAWRAENSAIAVSQGTYGRFDLTTKSIGVIVPISLELLMSASNIDQLITQQITTAIGLQIDQACISADGTQNTVRGIVPQLSTGNIVDVGAQLANTTAYGKWGSAIGKVLAANAELGDISILHNSDVETALDNLQDAQYQPLRPTPNYASIKQRGGVMVANGILTEGTPAATYSLVGDFSQLLLAVQQSLMIEVSREGSYVDGGTVTNAFSHGQVLIRALVFMDVAVLRKDFFAQVDDIRFA